jgi:hypothetical protein
VVFFCIKQFSKAAILSAHARAGDAVGQQPKISAILSAHARAGDAVGQQPKKTAQIAYHM